MTNCPICNLPVNRHGRDRNGHQRFWCPDCKKTFTEPRPRLIGNLRISIEKAEAVIALMMDGMSIRAIERFTKVHQNTILSLLEELGPRCMRFFERKIRNTGASDIQCDEIWDFVGCKAKTAEEQQKPEDQGDAWCFTAIDRKTKLMLAWHLGKRSDNDTHIFSGKLYAATAGRVQISTDGFPCYQTAIPSAFGWQVDFGQIIKVYGDTGETPRKYSPGQVVDMKKRVVCGKPRQKNICTSHAERQNLNIRMHIRRMTRLTNAFSKKWENHEYALALFFCFYNFCRVHLGISNRHVGKRTPAMMAKLTDHVWSIRDLLEATATHC